MLYAFGFERVGVLVSDLYFVNPRPYPGEEGAERGHRNRAVDARRGQGRQARVRPSRRRAGHRPDQLVVDRGLASGVTGPA